ncbi:MAG TPA: nuclear transport factor 2 family protein [Flavisolibacter sp.]
MLLFATIVYGQPTEKSQVEKAIHNYVDAFYQADTSKAYESIARDLAKRGYYTGKDGKGYEAKMSFEQLVKLAKRWKNTVSITPQSPKKITVFDVLDRIATAKVEAHWGIDYFHLAKINGKWMIINVLWQDYPAPGK